MLHRISRPDFAQIIRLERNYLRTREMVAPLQRDEQLLDFVKFYAVAHKARDMMASMSR
jgi:hypothetical protein